MTLQPGTLYVVGTPIGNLEDMTFRAVRILQSVDLIAAEDTRHTARLLQHFQVTTPQISYHEHNRLGRIPELLNRLEAGEAIAMVTDAGMPAISDPGYELVRAVIQAGVHVVPIPGASAAVTALSVAGLATERFVFEGFLPVKGTPRRDRLEALRQEPRTVVLYESPHRLRRTLADLSEVLGPNRLIVLARELTKVYEELWRGTLDEAIACYRDREPRGEFTLVLDGYDVEIPVWSDAVLKKELQQLMAQGVSRSQASRQLAQQTSLSRRQIYQLALDIPDSQILEQ